MKKSDLKNGYVVELENGQTGLVFINHHRSGDIISLHSGGGMVLSCYTEDLLITNDKGSDYKIVKVFATCHTTNHHGWRDRDLIWERQEIQEIKEVTVAQLEAELGYPIKIVK
jgi:hypothetical protein